MASIPGVSDLIRLLQVQTEALASLPHTLMAVNKSLKQLADVISHSAETAASVQRLTRSMEDLLGELEQPLRDLAPGLTKVAVVLNDPFVEDIPKTINQLTKDVLPILQGLRDTQSKVAGIAATTDRMMSLVDDVQTRVAALPGANLLTRRRPGGNQPAARPDPA